MPESVGPTRPDDTLEPDEIEELEEEKLDKLFIARLTKNRQANYAMLRKLKPVKDSRSLSVIELVDFNDKNFFETRERIAQFKEWKAVEGGQIQVQESSDLEDSHGYAVVRPENDPTHEIVLRTWQGELNSAIIIPKSDKLLPHHGRQKDEILEQMVIVSGEELNKYVIWLERMRKAE